GLLKFQEGFWYCIINSRKPRTHQKFTLAHELYHFDHHRHLSTLFADYGENSQLEHEANLYAAELLMPKEELLSTLPDLYEPEQITSQVEQLSRKFDVSFESMVRRLMDLRALRKDLGEWLLSGAAQANMPTPNITPGETASLPKLPEKHLPVIYPEDAFPYNSEFRYPGDPPHWIRLRQPPPEEAKLFAQGIEVAGISFDSARENALSFAYGKERSLELKRDPQNPCDQNAIEVIGHWRDEKGKEYSGLLGYVPRELAARLAQEAPKAQLSATLETLILPRRKKSPGIRFSIWASSSK
ncbi:MAG: ImmA/IrrE family metallo-endopeptidase, partial [bacterium]